MIRLLMAIGLALMTAQAFAQVQVPKSYSDGEVIDADELNTNLKAIADAVPPRNCTTDQIIKWDDTNDVWVCATDPFAGLNCNVGDQLRMGSGGWECSAEPITAILSKNSWEVLAIGSISAFFDNVSNVTSASYCEYGTCYIEVPGVADHTSCAVQVTGSAVTDRAVFITTATADLRIADYGNWRLGEPVYINISCTP